MVNRLAPNAAGERKVRPDFEVILLSAGATSTKRLPSYIVSSPDLNELTGLKVIHPFDVRGEKHVRRRAVFDLTGECGACRKGEFHGNRGILRKTVANFL